MRHWLGRGLLAWLLLPISGLAWCWLWVKKGLSLANPAKPLPAPVVVVGNLLAGSTGKTPVVAALVRALQSEGLTVGLISRGYGRATGDASSAVRQVTAASTAPEVGDEPLLLYRLTGAPIFVGARRRDAALALLAAYPGVEVIVSDDGLQHDTLPRSFAIAVFDERGVGNGWLLPAGPLRQPLLGPLAPEVDAVLYNAAHASTRWPGLVLTSRMGAPLPLAAWASRHAAEAPGTPVPHYNTALPPGRWLAAAGIGQPERFFRGLEQLGLRFERMPLADHAKLSPLPWRASDWAAVLVTEKDAVKLNPDASDTANVWVVPHSVDFPTDVLRQLLATVSTTPNRHGHSPA